MKQIDVIALIALAIFGLYWIYAIGMTLYSTISLGGFGWQMLIPILVYLSQLYLFGWLTFKAVSAKKK
jgi:hypothetical protein